MLLERRQSNMASSSCGNFCKHEFRRYHLFLDYVTPYDFITFQVRPLLPDLKIKFIMPLSFGIFVRNNSFIKDPHFPLQKIKTNAFKTSNEHGYPFLSISFMFRFNY